jgi:mono/diheme cytochrome c family protein
MRLPVVVACASALGVSPALAQQAGDPASGHAFAVRVCSECHMVEARGAGTSPGGAPAFAAVAGTAGISATALGIFFQTSHHSMPNFILAPADQRDVIAYILSLKQ